MGPGRVWYVAYGSNVNRDRFTAYLNEARDPTPPSADRFAQVPLRLCFGNRSTRWKGGGVCFVFPDPDSRCWVRAWNITAEQFEDVFAQENRLAIASPIDWAAVAALAPVPDGHLDIGTSWYRRILRLAPGELGLPADSDVALTFTSARPIELNPPHGDYRSTIATGLADHGDLDPEEIDAYLNDATQ